MRLWNMTLAALVVFATMPAHADAVFCAGQNLANEWHRGHAAFDSGDHPKALSILRPLAENGFAPAQWLMGRMVIGGQGTAQDDETGLLWLRLARRGEMPGINGDIRALESRLPMDKIIAVQERADGWRPNLSPTCQPGSIPVQLSVVPALMGQRERLYDWWMRLVENAHHSQVDAGPYLRSLDSVNFTDSVDVNAAIARTPQGNMLVVSAALAEMPAAKAISLLMPAARELVNDRMVRMTAPPPPVETYKGIVLRGYAGRENQPFFDTMRRTMDMVPRLPPHLRNQIAGVHEVRYMPSLKYSVFSPLTVYKTAYIEDKKAVGGGYLAFTRDPVTVSSVDALGALLGPAIAKANANLSTAALNCRISAGLLDAAKSLDWDETTQAPYRRHLQSEKCKV